MIVREEEAMSDLQERVTKELREWLVRDNFWVYEVPEWGKITDEQCYREAKIILALSDEERRALEKERDEWKIEAGYWEERHSSAEARAKVLDRECVEREREAFSECYWWLRNEENEGRSPNGTKAGVEAARRYPMPREGDHGACMCSWEGERITWFNESCPVHAALRKEG